TPPPASYNTQASPRYEGQSMNNSAASRGITRAVSDEVDYPGYSMHKMPQRGPTTQRGSVNIEGALNDLIDYLDDRKAPLFVADSLSTLFRTKGTIHVEQSRVVETVVTWSRQKASITGRPIHEIFINVLSSIKHAEQARVLKDFD